MTNTYLKRLEASLWKQLCERVFQRDRWTCRVCRKPNRCIQAHHLFYKATATGAGDYREPEMVTLCTDCHANQIAHADECVRMLLMGAAHAGFVSPDEILLLSDFFVEIRRAIYEGDSSYLLRMLAARRSEMAKRAAP